MSHPWLLERIRRRPAAGVTTLEALGARLAFRTFDEFIERWVWKCGFLDRYEDFEALAESVLERSRGAGRRARRALDLAGRLREGAPARIRRGRRGGAPRHGAGHARPRHHVRARRRPDPEPRPGDGGAAAGGDHALPRPRGGRRGARRERGRVSARPLRRGLRGGGPARVPPHGARRGGGRARLGPRGARSARRRAGGPRNPSDRGSGPGGAARREACPSRSARPPTCERAPCRASPSTRSGVFTTPACA